MHERYGIWRESIGVLFGVEADKSIRDNDFSASIESHLLGSMMLMDVRTKQQTWGRTPRQIANSGMDHYGIGLFKDSALVCEDAKGRKDLKPGGLAIFDLTQAFEAKTSDLISMTMVVPRPLIEDQLNQPDDHSMRFLDPKDPMTRILYDQLTSIHRNIGELDQAQAGVIERSFSMLVASCLNSAIAESRETTHQRQSIMNLVKMRRYMREHLTSPDLTPRKAARDLGVSRSKLYDAFSAHGGVYHYIRDMRLRRAISLLNDPERRHCSIYDIALECGFSSDASFIRAFREKYELTPGDVRNGITVQQQKNLGLQGDLDTRYEDWLHQLMI
jgi:AraC-like DNA-binding protein